MIGLIVAYHGRSARSLYLSIALGFLLGGAIGNLIDRLRLGYVVDFVDIGIGDLRFYTFNVADAAISTAIVLLLGGRHRARPRRGSWMRRIRMVDPATGRRRPRPARPGRGRAAASTATSPTRPGCRGATSRSSSRTAG